jgi:Domain of Unknown Function (DUF1080).
MRVILPGLLLVTVCFGAPEWRPLFNGRDLTGWHTYLAKPLPTVRYESEQRTSHGQHAQPLGLDHDPGRVFTVVHENGEPVIRISGEVFGTLTMKESFRDYRLRFEMRWGERIWPPRRDGPRNSGLLYHARGDWGSVGAWLPSIEFQLRQAEAGELITIKSQAIVAARLERETEWYYDPNGSPMTFPVGETRRVCHAQSLEKPTGEWNVFELVCRGVESWHLVNGRIVLHMNAAYAPGPDGPQPLTSGRIQFQSEGAELFLRRIEITPVGDYRPE